MCDLYSLVSPFFFFQNLVSLDLFSRCCILGFRIALTLSIYRLALSKYRLNILFIK